MKFLRDLLTGRDGATHDLGRWSWIGSFFAVIGSTASNVWHGVAVDVSQLAQALGTVTVAHGAALWAKRTTEPGHDEPPKEP